MKALLKFLLMFSFFFSLHAVAQDPGDSRQMSDKSSLKGRKTLRQEKRVKKRSMKNAKKQERAAIRRSPVKKYTVGKSKKIKSRKNKEKKKGGEPKEKS